MIRKNYILREKSCDILQKVMKEKGLKSETAALEYVLGEYNENFVEMSLDKIYGEMEDLKSRLESIESIIKFVANNSEIMVDCMNTLMIARGYNVCYPVDTEPSEVLTKAEEYRKKRAEQNKIIKDNRRL